MLCPASQGCQSVGRRSGKTPVQDNSDGKVYDARQSVTRPLPFDPVPRDRRVDRPAGRFTNSNTKARTCAAETRRVARGMRSERGGCPPPSVCMRVLRQVVTERGKYHVVDRVSCRGTGACSVHSGPGIPDYVGILRTPLEAALRSIVEAIPEAEGALNDVPSVAVAIGKRIGDETIGAQHGRGVDGSCGSRQRQRLNGATVVPAEIAAVTFLAALPAAGVFTAHVCVNIQLRRWVEFQRPERLVAAEQCQRTVWARGGVREARCAVTADAVAAENVEADIEVFAERCACVYANTATDAGAIKGTRSGVC